MDYITTKEMQALEINSDYYGISTFELMDNAGTNIAKEIIDQEEIKSKHICAICGSGNNGGDGYVAAEHLAKYGAKVTIYNLSNPKKTESKHAFSKIKRSKIKDRLNEEKIINSDIIIDAIFGTGIRGEIKEPQSTAIDLINKSKAKIYSIDIPSGLDPNTGEFRKKVNPDYIITFHKPKIGLKGEQNVVKVDIGIPKEAEVYAGPGEIFKIQNRDDYSHKGENGRVLIIGGSIDYIGAPALSGLSALRSGADLVTIAAPKKVALAINTISVDLITKKLKGEYINQENISELLELAEKSDAILIGPGIGLNKETKDTLDQFIKKIDKKLVLDADALKLIDSNKVDNYIATPHAKEFEYFFNKKVPKDINSKKELILKYSDVNKVILLKGKEDIISDGKNIKLTNVGNSGMTVGGTGDVLAGLCVGFLSQSNNFFNSASSAAFLNGLVADKLKKKKGYYFLASDIIKKIPKILNKLI